MSTLDMLTISVILAILIASCYLVILAFLKKQAEDREEDEFYKDYYRQEEIEVRNARAREILETRNERKL